MNVRQEAIEKERIRCVISGLKRFELTEAESQFISLAEQNLNHNVLLDERIESILELIYSRKTEFIRNSVISLLSQKQERRFYYKRVKTALVRGIV
jgi:hypothetical protein